MSCCDQSINGIPVGQISNPVVLGPSNDSHVELLQSSPGVLRIINVGGTFSEGIDIDLDSAADIVAISSSTGATVQFDAPVNINAGIDINAGIALGPGVAATLGTIGGAGPAAAAQAQWLQVSIGGTVHFIPVWT